MWWDTHLHLDLLGDDGPARLRAAVDVGVRHFVGIGVDPRVPARLRAALPDDVAATITVGFAVGLHPQELPKLGDDDVEAAFSALDARLAAEGDIVAVGECGLDARRGIGDDDGALDRQRRVFVRHLAVARRTGLPLVLHGVRRDGPMLEVLDDDIAAHGALPGAVWHGYSGSRDTMRLAVARGVHIAIGFMALDERARRLREAIPAIPDEQLLLETDAPPLEPARLVDVAAAVAALRGQTVEHLMAVTSRNAERLFGRRARQPIG
jgi:TatD DNase family protein